MTHTDQITLVNEIELLRNWHEILLRNHYYHEAAEVIKEIENKERYAEWPQEIDV